MLWNEPGNIWTRFIIKLRNDMNGIVRDIKKTFHIRLRRFYKNN